MQAEELAREFTSFATEKLTQQSRQVIRCAELLSADEVRHRGNDHTNSVGNLLLHLNGNVRQWIVAGGGGEPFNRDRPAEFAAREPLPSEQLVGRLEKTVKRALGIIGGLDAAGLSRCQTIQGYDVSALTAVFHVVEHFSGHAGQIVHMTKVLKDVDLSLYDAEGRKRSGLGALP